MVLTAACTFDGWTSKLAIDTCSKHVLIKRRKSLVFINLRLNICATVVWLIRFTSSLKIFTTNTSKETYR
eukprot:762798-Hanusia_phi.AAC.4